MTKPTTTELTKQARLDGMEHPKLEAVEAAAERHQDSKNRFKKASDQALETKKDLISAMQEFAADKENADFVERQDDGTIVARYKLEDGEVVEATYHPGKWDVKIKKGENKSEGGEA